MLLRTINYKIPASNFNHVDTLNKNIEVTRSELNGKRVYYVNNIPLYSITTILSHGHEWVNEWISAVGEDYAKSVSHIASAQGQEIHTLCESYLYNKELDISNNVMLYHRFKKFTKVLNNINNVYCLEKMLYSLKLKIAGTVDCIAEYNNVLSIIDFKTSKREKLESEIEDYFLQTTAYAIMVYELFNIKITQIVILMSVDSEEPIVYIKNIKEYIPILRERIRKFYKSMEIESDNT